ncbi:MAG: 1-deoxy-D-xylulose-5-phosphate synthase [Candidatus Melainabacteria bacterium]|nr:1-deoxy-D-xylulose-5-phosphate synthase [Candidatus Melainabacteria bacterium]
MHTLTKQPTSFLDAITGPAELKHMSVEDLQKLAGEIRQEIVNNLSRTGGHLSSNLGVVEITLALHRVFNTPTDQILWDVGHQAYVHKMLTGRRHKFDTLRQFKGLSGYVTPFESEHDAFVAGHSSTSVSLAVGMAIARDHLKQDHKVIAVIGDGGLTGGMALEAINHLGHIQKNVLIVLNDNEMSISENTGGLALYMKRIKETFFYRDIKEKLDSIEGSLDKVQLTAGIWDMILEVKKQAKERFDTPGIVFEKLGINYSGPIDGHDVSAVVRAMEAVKDKSAPQIVHLITCKGKGYQPAEDDSIKYHGVPAFSLEPQLREKVDASPSNPKSTTYSDVFTQALIDVAKEEPNLVAITPATAEGSGLVKFGKAYPERFFDVAICEQHAVTMAAGMAKAGLKPVVSIYSTFLQRAMDQVIHDVAILSLPVVFGVDRGGLVEDGETHQGVFDIAFLRSVPNFTVLAPKDAAELRDMVYTAVKESNGPVAIRFPRDKAIGASADGTEYSGTPASQPRFIEPTEWQIVAPGARSKTVKKPAVILAFGAMVDTAQQALDMIETDQIPMLVNARSAKPLDVSMLNDLLRDGHDTFITIEEGCLSGGFGAAILEWMSTEGQEISDVTPRVLPIAIPDQFVEHGARAILLDLNGLSKEKLAQRIKKIITK